MRTTCPSCQSENTVRNGRIHTGKQNRKCKACGRQFVQEPEKVFIPQEKWDIVDRLLLEKLPIAGIARALQISENWVQEYVKRKYAQVPQQVQVTPKKKGV